MAQDAIPDVIRGQARANQEPARADEVRKSDKVWQGPARYKLTSTEESERGFLPPISLARRFPYSTPLMKNVIDTHIRIYFFRLGHVVCLLSILSVVGCSSTTLRARQTAPALRGVQSPVLPSRPTTPQQLAAKPAPSVSTQPSRPPISPLVALSRPRGLLRPHVPAASGSGGLGVSQTGVASWYGPGFHGRMTANGEVYNQFGMTAAHKTLPFGSRVRVTNLHTGQSIEVRINDRGPYIRGRIIDVS